MNKYGIVQKIACIIFYGQTTVNINMGPLKTAVFRGLQIKPLIL